MAAFQYTAVDKKGNASKGTIEADSHAHARQLIRDQGLFPIEISNAKKNRLNHTGTKLSAQDLSLLTRQLATLIAAGIPLDEALKGVCDQSTKANMRQIILGVRAKVLEGYSLAEALSSYPKSFPEIYRATITAGEQTGQLDVILEHLANYVEAQQSRKQRVAQALIYPIVMLSVSVMIIVFLLSFVVPKIISVFSESEQSLPIFTVILVSISHGLKNYGLYLLLLIVAGFFLFQRALKNIAFKRKWHLLLMKIPLVSKLFRDVNLARYIHTFSMLFGSGVSVIETMKVSASVVSLVPMKESLLVALTKVQEGIHIHQALSDTQYLPPMTAHLIANGEKSGRLASMMERAANQLDEEIKQITETFLTLLEPLIILLMGSVVLFIVLATLLPIFSMEQLVG